MTAQDVHSELGSTTRSQLAAAARLQPPTEASPESATQRSEPVEDQGSAALAESPSTSSGSLVDPALPAYRCPWSR